MRAALAGIGSTPQRYPVSKTAHRGGPGPRTEGFAPGQAGGVYDRIGWLQDTQLVFEAPALARLTADGRLSEAHYPVEIGCGTGRFARDLLTNVCDLQCRDVGLDVSPRMCRIATARLSRWSARARVMQVDGTLPLPLPAAGADRVAAAFVVDLLPTEYARQLLADTHGSSRPGVCCAWRALSRARRGPVALSPRRGASSPNARPPCWVDVAPWCCRYWAEGRTCWDGQHRLVMDEHGPA